MVFSNLLYEFNKLYILEQISELNIKELILELKDFMCIQIYSINLYTQFV